MLDFLTVIKLMDPSNHALAYGSMLLAKSGDLKSYLIDNLVKLVVSHKGRASSHVLLSLSPFLKTITHDDFKGQLLQPMLKAMLRNPEMVMESFSIILGNLGIDLSQYVTEFSKPFATQLHASDDSTRAFAVLCVASLGSKCSDAEAILSILDSIFKVLAGSEGKLSVASHKLSLLQAAAALADNSVLSSKKSELCEKATEYFVKVLETEIHEGTLIQALDALQLWFGKSACREVPNVYVQWIPKGLALKSITSALRTGYFQCLLEAILHSSASLKCEPELLKSISKIMDNASRQSAQVAIVTEAVHCAACYIRMNPEAVANPNDDVMKVVLDPKLGLFTSEKFLSGASSSAFKSLALVAEQVILQNSGNNDTWMRALAIGLTNNDGSTRTFVALGAKRLGNVLGGEKLLKQLASQLNTYLWQSLDLDQDNLKVGNVKTGIANLVKAFGTDNGAEMANALLPICFHPAVHASDSDLWTKSCSALKVDPSE